MAANVTKTATAEHRPVARTRLNRWDDLVAVDLFCVDAETEILTAAGWKRYDEVHAGDLTLAIRQDGSGAEWQEVSAVNVFAPEMRMLHRIEGRGISALTTDNHRWLSSYRRKTAAGREYSWRMIRSDELTCEDRIPMCAEVMNLPTHETIPDSLVELVAWYWTEGTDGASGRVHITQDHTINPRHCEAIKDALLSLYGLERDGRKRPAGPLWARNYHGKQTTFGLNREAAAPLRAAAPGKVVSTAWLSGLSQRQLNLFIQRSLDADGHERVKENGSVERVISQAVEERASAFQAACLMAGKAASMKRYDRTYRHGDVVRPFESWAVTVGMREFVKPLRQKVHDVVEHHGLVWCPTTPNGTWLARRNGTCYFTGNSGFGGLTQGIEAAGFTTIMAANHNAYKVEVHEANHPNAEHWIADLVDPTAGNYHSASDLPKADLLVAGFSCFTAGSLVLTRRGLVPIEAIEIGDEVWTHRRRWRAVTHTSAIERSTITVGATTPITCTPDHPFLAASAERVRTGRRRFQPIEGAACNDCGGAVESWGQSTTKAKLYCSRRCSQRTANRLALAVLGRPRETRADQLAGMWVGTPILEDDAPVPIVPELGGEISADAAWILGRWSGDGWVTRRRARANKLSHVTICCSHAEADALEDQLNARSTLSWSRTPTPTTVNFTTARQGLAAFLAADFGSGAAQKRIPPWLLFAPAAIKRAFVDGYLAADGTVYRDGLKVQASSVSKELAVGVRLLLTSLGYYATVSHQQRPETCVIEGRTVNQQSSWTLAGYLCSERRPKHRDSEGYRWGNAGGAVKAGEVTTVYNMTVEEDHTYVVDGVLVHNCTNHSQANSERAYAKPASLFDVDDSEYESRVTRSERDRATANCFPAGTVVTARHGMVAIEDLHVGDEVLTHEGRWKTIAATRMQQAPVLTIKGRGHTSMQVTADHRFLTRSATLGRRGWTFGEDRWTAASELVGNAWQSPAKFPTEFLPEAPTSWSYDADFWWTVGRWLGDGWIRHCTPSGEMVGICCGVQEREELDGRWSQARVTPVGSTMQYELRGSGTLARWLMAYFGEHAHGKTIPSWVLGMPETDRRALIEGYMSADGCISLEGRRASAATVSRRLAVGLKLLLQSVGHRPTLRRTEPGPWHIEGRTGESRPVWTLQWMNEYRRASTIALIDGRCVGVVRELLPAGEPVNVYDIEVNDDHSFVADGIIVHNCLLHYATKNKPLMILGECTTEFVCWGRGLPNKPKIGDGTTYRWWLSMFEKLGYKHKVLYLNSMFFGVGQSRDRAYWVFWDKRLPTPDLEHRPESWCAKCDETVQAEWTWRTRIPPSGSVRYGKQYDYRCPWCRSEVKPPFTPSLDALDLSDLGTRIGDRPIKKFVDKKTGAVFYGPMAKSTMARAERCMSRFGDFPAVLMPAKAMYGAERSPYEPMGTQTSQQEAALLSTGMVTYAHEGRGDGHGPLTPPIAAGLVDFRRGGHPRGVDEELPTQTGSETMGLLSARILPMRTNGTSRDSGEPSETIVANAGSGGLSLLSTGIVPFRQNTIPQNGAEPMGTQTSECIPGVLTAAGRIQCNGDPAEGRTYPLNRPLGTVVGSAITQGLLFGGWYKQNGAMGTETAPHPMSDPYGTITGRDTTAMLMAQWQERLKDLKLEDCFFRMMTSHEIGRGCGFDVDFPGYGYQGSYLVWGSARDQVDGFGNAVSPQVGRFIGERLYKVLHEDLAS